MISYVTIGCRDLDEARAFYDELLAPLGVRVIADLGRLMLYGNDPHQPMFAICTPFDGLPASAGNGTMIAFSAPNKEQVEELHSKALALGATDEGAPGLRSPAFYIAYLRDLDGNKLAFITKAD